MRLIVHPDPGIALWSPDGDRTRSTRSCISSEYCIGQTRRTRVGGPTFSRSQMSFSVDTARRLADAATVYEEAIAAHLQAAASIVPTYMNPIQRICTCTSAFSTAASDTNRVETSLPRDVIAMRLITRLVRRSR